MAKFSGYPHLILRTLVDIDCTDLVTADGSPACSWSYIRLIQHLLGHSRSIDGFWIWILFPQ